MKLTYKLILGVVLLWVLIWGLGVCAVAEGRRALRDSITASSAALAATIMDDVDEAIDTVIDDWLVYLTSPDVQRAVKASNRQFEQMPDVRGYIDRQDREWRSVPHEATSPFMRDLLANELSRRLLQRIDAMAEHAGFRVFGEAFVTNEYGANVAQTGKTSDYRQDDEDWWQRARHDGVYVSDIKYDESAGISAADVCIRVDDEKGAFIGVLKAVLNVKALSAVLRSRDASLYSGLGSATGRRVILLTADGKIIFPADESSAQLQDGSQYLPDREHQQPGRVHASSRDDAKFGEMLTCWAVSRGYGRFQSMGWMLVVEHRASSVFAPIAPLQRRISEASATATLIVLGGGGWISLRLSRRIARLKTAAARVGAGDLDTVIDDASGDEFGQLARSFNGMTRRLSETLVSKTALEAANQAKSEFLANMSHEIRSPLTAILGFSDLLKERSLTEADRLNWLSTIQRNGEHLLGLINDILDLSKVEAGKVVLKAERCRLVTVVADVISMMRIRAQQRGLELSVRYAGPIPETVLADEKRLRQVLINLVGNAVKFTESGSVTVGVSFLPQWRDGQSAVQLAVADTGIGIAAADVRGLCEPFHQVDGSAARKAGGTGLGLAISRRLVELMGGELTIQSEVGKGSTFAATIPTGPLADVPMLQQPSEAILAGQPCAGPKAPSEYRLDGASILVAEDGPDNQRLIRILLTKAGAKVELAENGRVAVERAMATHPDLILMDMQMPEMDGYQATRLLREKGFRAPIVALTAHALMEDRQQCLSAGCTGYLAKPIDRYQLLKMVAESARGRSPRSEPPDHPPPSEPTAAPEVIVSEYANDPDLAEVIGEFVAGLGHRTMSMREALANGHFDEFRRLSHQLKGAGGSYGYRCLTDVAGKLEELAKAADVEGSTLAMAELERLCQAVMRGHARVSLEES
jgi:signal transduction histidine kinase/DNA-binding response OmpR family regulator